MPVVSEATSAIDKVALEREEQRIRHIGELRSKDSEILKYVPSIFRFDRAPIEATGISLDSFTRGSVLATHWFIGPVILSLAQHQVRKECTEEVATADFSECEANGRVYGFKPTSLLSNIMVVAGVVGAVLLPIIGAIVDHTPHRKQVAAIAALLLTLSMGLELIIGENTWFAVACLQVVASITYLVLTTAAYAYSSELSDDPDEQTIYQSWFYFFWFISSVLIFGTVAFLHFVFEIKEVNAARIVLTLNLMISVLGFGYAWKYLFQDRPALIKRENDSLLLTGLRHLARSTRHIGSNLPSLRWFLISVIFAEAANNAMATISATYLTDVVKMQPNEIAAVFTLAMLFGMPGAILGKLVSLKHGPLTSAKYCEMCYVVLLLISAVLLTDPSSQKIFAYFYGAFWGVLMGTCEVCMTLSCTV
jgi:MFS transporter, UMF1 family